MPSAKRKPFCFCLNVFTYRARYLEEIEVFLSVREYIFRLKHQNDWKNADSMVHGANMGTTWVLSVPDGPHVGPMNLAIRVGS